MRLFSRNPLWLAFALVLLVVLTFAAREARASGYGGYGYGYYSYPSQNYGYSYYYPSYGYYSYVPSTYVSPYSSYYAAPSTSYAAQQAPCPQHPGGANTNDALFKELAIRLLAERLAPQGTAPASPQAQPLRQAPAADPGAQLTPQEVQMLRQVLRKLAEPPAAK